MACSRNNCYGKATTLYFCIIFELHVAVNNVQVFTVAMGRNVVFPPPPFSSYKLFHTVLRNVSNLGLQIRCPKFCPILNKFGISRQTFLKAPYIKFHKNPSNRNHADSCGQTEGRTDGQVCRR